MPQNAKAIPAIRTGHPRASITASNRLYMEELSELGASCRIKAIEYYKKRRFAILLGIDSNAHSDIWGHSNNTRGNDLVDYIIQEGLVDWKSITKGKNIPMRALLENLSLT